MNDRGVIQTDQPIAKRAESPEQARRDLASDSTAVGAFGERAISYVRERPLASVGLALGTGFVLGSIVGTRMGRLALAAAVSYATEEVIEATVGHDGLRRLLVDEASKLVRKVERSR